MERRGPRRRSIGASRCEGSRVLKTPNGPRIGAVDLGGPFLPPPSTWDLYGPLLAVSGTVPSCGRGGLPTNGPPFNGVPSGPLGRRHSVDLGPVSMAAQRPVCRGCAAKAPPMPRKRAGDGGRTVSDTPVGGPLMRPLVLRPLAPTPHRLETRCESRLCPRPSPNWSCASSPPTPTTPSWATSTRSSGRGPT
ncbi:hypothetical protein M885DRAFT_28271 [Pelagophyceae sp. CCMP2097]|nr:hypothetical protein M885DRAFT_28271 [Pelagophyceae sp. CCMP2097]